MQFLDTNVFVYTYNKPRLASAESEELKTAAQAILVKAGNREIDAVTSVVHLSETANLLARCFTARQIAEITRLLLAKLQVLTVTTQDYLLASEESSRRGIGINDCLAYVLMQKNGITEIYSSDSDFDAFQGIKRLW